MSEGTVASLKDQFGGGSYQIVVRRSKDFSDLSYRNDYLQQLISRLAPETVMQVNKEEEHFFIPTWLETRGGGKSYNHIVEVVAMLENEGPKLGVESFSIDCTSLEKIFMSMVTKENEEDKIREGDV